MFHLLGACCEGFSAEQLGGKTADSLDDLVVMYSIIYLGSLATRL